MVHANFEDVAEFTEVNKNMIRTETAKRYGGTKAIPLTEFDFIVPGKKYIVQDAEIDGDHCIIIREEKAIRRLEIKDVKDK